MTGPTDWSTRSWISSTNPSNGTRSTWGGPRSVAPFRTEKAKRPAEPRGRIEAAAVGWGGGPAGC
eukprot:6413516-Alexandrium_andersonii.AAC.1